MSSLNSLPNGFINEILSFLHPDTRYHLINSLYSLTSIQPHKNKQGYKGSFSRGQLLSDPENHSIQLSDYITLPIDTNNLKRFIFNNIKECKVDLWSSNELQEILLKLILSQSLPNLTTLELNLSSKIRSRVQITPKQLQSGFMFMNKLENLGLNGVLDCIGVLGLFCDPSSLSPDTNSSQNSPDIVLPSNNFFSSLITLDLSQNTGFSNQDDLFLSLVQSPLEFPKLTTLHLPHLKSSLSPHTFDQVLDWIGTSLPSLKAIEFASKGSSNIIYLTKLLNTFPHLITSISFSSGSSGGKPSDLQTFLQAIRDLPHQTPSQLHKISFAGSLPSSTQPTSLIDTLTQSPFLKEVKNLTLQCCGLTDNDVKSICTSPYLTNLVELNLLGNPSLTSSSFYSISTSSNMQGLQILKYHNFGSAQRLPLDSNSLRFISESSFLSNLTHLSLSRVELTPFSIQDFRIFINSSLLSNLESLHFNKTLLSSSPTLSNYALSLIATSPNLSKLTSLNLSNQVFSSTLAASLLNSSNLSHLIFLDLSSCQLTDDDLYYLSQSQWMGNLQSLNLNDNTLISDKGIRYLTQSSHLMKLQSLYINGCKGLTIQSAEYIKESLYLHLSLINLSTELGNQWKNLFKSNCFLQDVVIE